LRTAKKKKTAEKKDAGKEDLKRFLKISIPIIIGGVVWSIGAFIYRIVYGHMDSHELAVMTMLEPVNTICFSFFWGVSSAAGVIVGHNLGAGNSRQAYAQSFVLTAIGFFVSVMAAAGIWMFKEPVLGLFGALEAETLALAEDVLVVVLGTVWIRAINVVSIVGVLQSGGDNRFVLAMDVFCQWVVGIPLAFLAAFYFDFSLKWVYLAATGEEIVKLFIAIPRMYSRAWMRNLVS
jgi:Na+-driven multidrug efflux pump